MKLKNRKNRKSPMAEINVVPYIDVMLVLLVIFMITTPLLSQGVNVDLPHAASKPITAKQQEPIIVSIDAKGLYYLNISATPDQPIDASALTAQVTAGLQGNQQGAEPRQVLVKGDQSVDYGKVMQAMVLLQQAGVPGVGLITQPSESAKS
jgi:biopolymer transport protein TolR